MLSLYLLRHGETEFSRSDRFCGDIDAPLTDAGVLMAEQFADAYDDLHWRGIITSTRLACPARNTAACPAELPPPTTATSDPRQSCASAGVAA